MPHVRVRDAALEADAWWLAVPDDEIYAVAGRLAETLPAIRRAGAPQPIAVHSSGLGSVHLLKPLYEQGVRVLCLHPLQTFTGEPSAELLRGVPCAVTALEERDLQLGEELAGRLGMRPFRLADEQKTLYHLSAVVGCNLLVALESEAKRLMDEATGETRGLDHLSVLLETTMRNLLQSGEPAFALTGPVARGDIGTVRAHLRLLDRESPRLARTYRALSLEALTLAAPRLDDEQVETLRGAARGRGSRRRSRRPRRPGGRRAGDRGPLGGRPAVIVARTVAEARAALRKLPRPLGFVPTMGALHAGHLSLVDAARRRCASVAASVFVNPAQFGAARTSRRTRATRPATCASSRRRASRSSSRRTPTRCTRKASPPRSTSAAPLTETFEGASRPSHFDGVAVIVTKLLGVVQPDVLFLGEKDAQQLAVVRRFVRDLDLPVEVVGVPTVREPDGLAMSSRNVYLTPEQRAVAPDLYRALLAGGPPQARPARPPRTSSPRRRAPCCSRTGPRPRRGDEAPARPRFELDYLAVVDEDTFVPEGTLGPRSRLVVAARLGSTRLIDTIKLDSAYPAKDATA